jgi:hypothetical protein
MAVMGAESRAVQDADWISHRPENTTPVQPSFHLIMRIFDEPATVIGG